MPSDAPSGATRLPFFDNARGLLILLVGAGHALEPLLGTEPLARGLYAAVYLFHIPAFAALSGHLSKAELTTASLRSLLASVGAPLLVFHLLYVVFDVAVLQKPLTLDHLTRPYWLLWFLASLLCWRLLLPLLLRTRAPLVAAIVLALGAGALPWIGYELSASRTFVFLPFFVAGHLFRREWLEQLSTRAARAMALAAFVLLASLCAGIATGSVDSLDTRWLYGSSSYGAIGVSVPVGVALRAALLAASGALCLAFFAWVPTAALGRFTAFGATSLAPYLLHGFAVRTATHLGVFSALLGASGVGLAAVAGLAVVLILGAGPVVRLSRPLWNPASVAARYRLPQAWLPGKKAS